MRTNFPTAAEIDATPVTDEDIAAYEAQLTRVATILDQGQIPPTLDWACAMCAVAAQAAAIVGMPRELFIALAESAHDDIAHLPQNPAVVMPTAPIMVGAIKTKARQVLDALAKAEVVFNLEICTVLLAHAIRVFHYGGFTRACVSGLADRAYNDAVDVVHTIAKKNGQA